MDKLIEYASDYGFLLLVWAVASLTAFLIVEAVARVGDIDK